MAKKETIKIDYDNLKNEMSFTITKACLNELEWVNLIMMNYLFELQKNPADTIILLREDLYKRIEGYKNMLVSFNKDKMNIETNDLNEVIN